LTPELPELNRVLITGGAGFIGSNLVEYFNLRSPKTDVLVFDDFSTGFRENLSGLECEVREHSVLDYENLRKAAKGADAIVHLGAIGSVPRSIAHPRPTHEVNVTGTLNVLEAARQTGVNHVIVASSSSVYGSNPSMPKSELDWTRPQSPYAVSKLATEAYALAYQASFKLKTLAFRFFNVYGPRQRADHDYAAVIPRFIDAAIREKPLTVYGDGKQSRDFTFVDSVCSALYTSALMRITDRQPVNLAFGTNTSLLELVEKLSQQLNRTFSVHYEDARMGDVRASQADSSYFRKLFPSIDPVGLETGLSKTIEWFLSQSEN
jgi:UDP-glucose 4-epimerase